MIESSKSRMTKLEYGFYFLFVPIYALLYSSIGQLAQARGVDYGHLLALNFDQNIPLIPLLVIPYVLTFVYLYCIIAYLNHSIFFLRRTMWAIISLALLLNLFYFCFPTYYPMRVDITSLNQNNFLTKIMTYTYSCETSWNSFPSSHIAFPWLILRIFMLDLPNSRVVTSLKLFFICVVFSVVAIKVHFVLDIIGGIIAAELIYQLIYKTLQRNVEWVANVRTNQMLCFYASILITVSSIYALIKFN